MENFRKQKKDTVYYYKFDENKLLTAKKIAEMIRNEQTEEAVKIVQQNFKDFLEFMRALIEAERLKQLNP